VVIAARIIVVYGMTPFLKQHNEKIPWKWRHLLFWGALRGSICMALALSLPDSLAAKETITITTFGVVLFTLLVPGLTIEPLVKLLGMNLVDPVKEQYKELKARLITKKRAANFLAAQFKSGAVSSACFELLNADLQEQKDSLKKQIENLHIEDASVKELEIEEVRHRLAELENDCLKELTKEGFITEDGRQRIQLDLPEQ
jgi:CPA1 family monovalent cation:H+ antiporter